MKPLFPLGQIVITANAQSTIPDTEAMDGLKRHAQGDWGELSPDDVKENEQALKDGNRLMSVYRDSKGVKFWIITEADRSVTTILLPEDY